MENLLFKILTTLLILVVTSALTSIAYKMWKPSERANRIAAKIIRIFLTAIGAIYIILADLGYVEPITPSPKQ